VVYISRRTPVVAAIKRVKKFLGGIEKRALDNAGAGNGNTIGNGNVNGKGTGSAIKEANEALAREKETVLVKASGRAMGQALRVAEHFRTRETEMLCDVEVRTGSVSAVDDIVALEEGEENVDKENEPEDEDTDGKEETGQANEVSTVQCGDTNLELLGGADLTGLSSEKGTGSSTLDSGGVEGKETNEAGADGDGSLGKQSRRKRKKRKRQMYEADEVPEARIRWVKTVEVAISLKG
jgi:ribonuclease P/MRP protein subunit POP7